jgi:hypothetical protein
MSIPCYIVPIYAMIIKAANVSVCMALADRGLIALGVPHPTIWSIAAKSHVILTPVRLL